MSTDTTTHTVSVLPFEVGSHTGHLTRDNTNTLHTLHKFCRKDVKFRQFTKNISSIVVLSSYYIFNCRNVKDWDGDDFILPPFSNQWPVTSLYMKIHSSKKPSCSDQQEDLALHIGFVFQTWRIINPPMWISTLFIVCKIFFKQ